MGEPRRPTPAIERLEFIDALRGFALFGVFWANLHVFSGINYMTDGQRAALFTGSLDSTAYFLERFLIENKFVGLFSFLFGISFWLFISRAQSRGGGGIGLFYRRVGWLILLGLLHGGLLWWGDILRFYALWALVLPLFTRTPPRRLLPLAFAAGVLVPALASSARAWIAGSPQPATDHDAIVLAAFSTGTYRDVLIANLRYDAHLTFSVGNVVYQVALFGRILLGVYVARTVDFSNLGARRVLLRTVAIVGGLAGVIGSTVFAARLLAGAAGGPLLLFVRRFLVEGGQMGLTLAYAAALALLFLNPRWRSAVRAFAPVGRMALTWYLFQTVFGVWVFYGFARGPSLMGNLPAVSIVALAVVGFGIQLVLARTWLSRFQFGPAEWLWRTLTYWKVQPLRIVTPGPRAAQA